MHCCMSGLGGWVGGHECFIHSSIHRLTHPPTSTKQNEKSLLLKEGMKHYGLASFFNQPYQFTDKVRRETLSHPPTHPPTHPPIPSPQHLIRTASISYIISNHPSTHPPKHRNSSSSTR